MPTPLWRWHTACRLEHTSGLNFSTQSQMYHQLIVASPASHANHPTLP